MTVNCSAKYHGHNLVTYFRTPHSFGQPFRDTTPQRSRQNVLYFQADLVEYLSRPNRDLRQFYQCNMFYFSILKICASDTQIHRIYIFPRNLFGQNTGFPRNSNDRNPYFPRFFRENEKQFFIPEGQNLSPRNKKRNNQDIQRLLGRAGDVLHKAEFEAVARLCVIVVILFSVGRSLCNHHLRI